MIAYKWGIAFGWEYLTFQWWQTMGLLLIFHFFITLILCHIVYPRIYKGGAYWLTDLYCYTYALFFTIWTTFLIFAFWYMIVSSPFCQKVIRAIFYYRFEWWFIKIGFAWFWDPFFNFIEWITGGYTTPFYSTYEKEYMKLKVLKEGCEMYKSCIISSLDENLRYRQQNEKYLRYTFRNRRGYDAVFKDAAFRVREVNHLNMRHRRFIRTIEAFADLGLKNKRSMDPKILNGALLNIDREMRLWKITFRKNFVRPYNKITFGPEVRIRSFWELPGAIIKYFWNKVFG